METKRISTNAKIEQIERFKRSAHESIVYVSTISLKLYTQSGVIEACDNEVKDLETFKEEWANDNCGRFIEDHAFVTLSQAITDRSHIHTHKPELLEYLNDAVLQNIENFEIVQDVEKYFFI